MTPLDVSPAIIDAGDLVHVLDADGTEMAAQPMRVRLISECGEFAYLEGSNTGWPVRLLTKIAEQAPQSDAPHAKRPRGRPRKDRTAIPCTIPSTDVANQIRVLRADLDERAYSKLRMDLKEEVIRLIDLDGRVKPSTAKVIHELLARFNWATGYDWHGVEHFMTACGLHRRTVIAAFKEGVACGYLLRRQVRRQGGGYRSETTLPIILRAYESMVAGKSPSMVAEKSKTMVAEYFPTETMVAKNSDDKHFLATLTRKVTSKKDPPNPPGGSAPDGARAAASAVAPSVAHNAPASAPVAEQDAEEAALKGIIAILQRGDVDAAEKAASVLAVAKAALTPAAPSPAAAPTAPSAKEADAAVNRVAAIVAREDITAAEKVSLMRSAGTAGEGTNAPLAATTKRERGYPLVRKLVEADVHGRLLAPVFSRDRAGWAGRLDAFLAEQAAKHGCAGGDIMPVVIDLLRQTSGRRRKRPRRPSATRAVGRQEFSRMIALCSSSGRWRASSALMRTLPIAWA
jgi:hypothetical protein